jgi:hypothetical protein
VAESGLTCGALGALRTHLSLQPVRPFEPTRWCEASVNQHPSVLLEGVDPASRRDVEQPSCRQIRVLEGAEDLRGSLSTIRPSGARRRRVSRRATSISSGQESGRRCRRRRRRRVPRDLEVNRTDLVVRNGAATAPSPADWCQCPTDRVSTLGDRVNSPRWRACPRAVGEEAERLLGWRAN